MCRFATNVTKQAWNLRREDAHFAQNTTKEAVVEHNIIIILISNIQKIINRAHNNNITLKIHHKDIINNITPHNLKVNI